MEKRTDSSESVCPTCGEFSNTAKDQKLSAALAQIETLKAAHAEALVEWAKWEGEAKALKAAQEAQQPVASVERWHGLVDQLAQRFKGYLPWPEELRDSVVRGHEMFIEDTIKKADALLNASPPAQQGPTEDALCEVIRRCGVKGGVAPETYGAMCEGVRELFRLAKP